MMLKRIIVVAALLIAVLTLFFARSQYRAEAQGFTFPNNPVVGQEVTGPGGVVYRWDGDKWVQVPPAPTLPVNNPQFTGLLIGTAPGNFTVPNTGTLTLPDQSTWTNTGLTLNASEVAPSSRIFMGQSSLAAGTSGVDLIQGARRAPSSGNWIANANTMTAVSQSGNTITFYGAVGLVAGNTFTPDPLVTLTSAAATIHVPTVMSQNNVTYHDNSFDMAGNVDGADVVSVLNRNAGTSAQTAFNLRNQLGTDTWFVAEGSGYVTHEGIQQPNTSGILSGGNPLWFADAWSTEYWPNGKWNVSLDVHGVRLPQLNDPPRSQLYYDVAEGGVLASQLAAYADNLNLMAGGYYDNGVWWSNQGAAQLLSMDSSQTINFYTMHGLGGTVPWVRNAYFDAANLNLSQKQDGSPYHSATNGMIVSWARPWDGYGTFKGVTAMWLPNGTCTPVSHVSGMLIATETLHWGHTAYWFLGGGQANLPHSSSDQRPPWYASPTCTPAAGRFGLCWSSPYYYLCNNTGYDTNVNVMMLETRANP